LAQRDQVPLSKEQIADWQRRLEDEFTSLGAVGGRILFPVFEAEERVGRRFAEHYRGHRVLHDSFLSCFGDTLFAAMRSINERGWPKDKPTYIVLFLWFQSMFRIARAADVLALSGYPIDAYAVLRSLKEEAFKTAAVVAG
jgi:hypothetical protein